MRKNPDRILPVVLGAIPVVIVLVLAGVIMFHFDQTQSGTSAGDPNSSSSLGGISTISTLSNGQRISSEMSSAGPSTLITTITSLGSTYVQTTVVSTAAATTTSYGSTATTTASSASSTTTSQISTSVTTTSTAKAYTSTQTSTTTTSTMCLPIIGCL